MIRKTKLRPVKICSKSRILHLKVTTMKCTAFSKNKNSNYYIWNSCQPIGRSINQSIKNIKECIEKYQWKPSIIIILNYNISSYYRWWIRWPQIPSKKSIKPEVELPAHQACPPQVYCDSGLTVIEKLVSTKIDSQLKCFITISVPCLHSD
jgi:hypothetical protein